LGWAGWGVRRLLDAFLVCEYSACQVAREEEVELLLSALGADALFAGFYKYRSVLPEELPAVCKRSGDRHFQTGFHSTDTSTDPVVLGFRPISQVPVTFCVCF